MIHVYKSNWSWPGDVESWLATQCIGEVLNWPCGRSRLGLRADIDPKVHPDVIADLMKTPPWGPRSFDTVICDPDFSLYAKWRWVRRVASLARRRVILSTPPTFVSLGRAWDPSRQVYAVHTSGSFFMRIFQVFTKQELKLD